MITGVINDGFGGAVAGGVDLDGDGIPDFVSSTPVVNASGPQVPYASARGVVRAFSGVTGFPIGVVSGFVAGSGMGGSLAVLRDSNGDGIGEVVSGNVSDDTALGIDGGSVEVVTFAGAQTYGSGNGALQLTFNGWTPGVPAIGVVLASGAGASHAGVIAADFAPGNSTIGTPPIPVYLGLTPSLIIYPVVFNLPGAWGLGIDLRNPILAGMVLYVQAFDVGGATITASPGLQLMFCH